MNNPHLAPLGLSVPAASRFRRVTVSTVGLLALFAAFLSFAGLRLLALEAGIPVELAWIFPILIDGLVLTGSLGVIASTLTGISTKYPWFITLLGIAASVVGNVASAPDDFLSRAVHAAPPIVFALSIEGLLRVYRVGAAALVVQVQHEQEELEREELERHNLQMTPQKVTEKRSPELKPKTAPVPAPVQPLPVESATPPSEDRNIIVVPENTPKNTLTARERIVQLLEEDPEITGAEAARKLNIDASHARKILRSLRETSRDQEPTAENPNPINEYETEEYIQEDDNTDFFEVSDTIEENPVETSALNSWENKPAFSNN